MKHIVSKGTYDSNFSRVGVKCHRYQVNPRVYYNLTKYLVKTIYNWPFKKALTDSYGLENRYVFI